MTRKERRELLKDVDRVRELLDGRMNDGVCDDYLYAAQTTLTVAAGYEGGRGETPKADAGAFDEARETLERDIEMLESADRTYTDDLVLWDLREVRVRL